MPPRPIPVPKLAYPTQRRIRAALKALNLPDGTTKPYRPLPGDFAETYVRIGWDGIEDHYGTNWRVIRRWIELAGGDRLRKARARYVALTREQRREARRLTAVKAAQARG